MSEINNQFNQIFGMSPSFDVFSPYRVCPLGAHVDHQKGLVSGFALDKGIQMAFSVTDEGSFHLVSADFPGEVRFSLQTIPSYVPGYWGNYLHGCAYILLNRYHIQKGIQGIVKGSLPIGGLSSSAAVMNAYLLALAKANNLELSSHELIDLGKFVENQYIGLNNGILDQASNILSKNNHLLFLDTKTEKYQLIQKPKVMLPFEIGVFYSGISKALISTDYNNRVRECRSAASILNQLVNPNEPIRTDIVLRDIDESVYIEYSSQLSERECKRATHFFTENNRVKQGVEAWKNGDLKTFGSLMFESGDSSVQNYESGSPELITLYHILKETPGIYGARFSGAGYRGCCIALVNPEYKDSIREQVTKAYLQSYPQFKSLFQIDFCKMDDGARIE
jgi:galactokinase/galacturonokinase